MIFTFLKWYNAATNHGTPTPMRTLTAIEPEICIRAPSACSSFRVTIPAPSISGNVVPNATNVMALNRHNNIENYFILESILTNDV